MTEKTASLKPPYATFRNFLNFFNKLRESTVPGRIDPTVFGNASGSLIYSVIASLKYLKLIDEAGVPTSVFIEFANATDEERPPLLRQIMEAGYPSLFSGGFDLSKATAGQFDEHVRLEFGAQGSTIDKVAAFFIAAANEAGIVLSPHLQARKPSFTSPSSKKSAKQRKHNNKPDGKREELKEKPDEKISEKALEYRLVDLMKETGGKAEVMTAIIAVITFLQTREAEE